MNVKENKSLVIEIVPSKYQFFKQTVTCGMYLFSQEEAVMCSSSKYPYPSPPVGVIGNSMVVSGVCVCGGGEGGGWG